MRKEKHVGDHDLLKQSANVIKPLKPRTSEVTLAGKPSRSPPPPSAAALNDDDAAAPTSRASIHPTRARPRLALPARAPANALLMFFDALELQLRPGTWHALALGTWPSQLNVHVPAHCGSCMLHLCRGVSSLAAPLGTLSSWHASALGSPLHLARLTRTCSRPMTTWRLPFSVRACG